MITGGLKVPVVGALPDCLGRWPGRCLHRAGSSGDPCAGGSERRSAGEVGAPRRRLAPGRRTAGRQGLKLHPRSGATARGARTRNNTSSERRRELGRLGPHVAHRGDGGAKGAGRRLDAVLTGVRNQPERIIKSVLHLTNHVEVGDGSRHRPAILRRPATALLSPPQQGRHLLPPLRTQTLQSRRGDTMYPSNSTPELDLGGDFCLCYP